VSVTLDKKAFEYFSEEQNRWITESGIYHIQIGVSSREIIAEKKITVISRDKGYLYHFDSPCERIFKNKNIKEACAFLPVEKKRFFIPDLEKDLILASPFANATQIYHGVEDNSMLIGDIRLTNSELSRVLGTLNDMSEIYERKDEE